MSRNQRLLASSLAALLLPACNGCEDDVQAVPGTLKGTICHQVTGRPSIGTEIVVAIDDQGNVTEHSGTSDELGNFEVGLIPPGRHVAHAVGEGVDVNFEVLIQSDIITEWLDPQCIDPSLLAGKGCVSGQVCNRHTGGFVSDATVEVVLGSVNYVGEPPQLTTQTNAQGVFQLCEVPEGSHIVMVRAPGFQRSYPANVTEGQTTEVTTAGTCEPFDPSQFCRVRGRICSAEAPPSWMPDVRVSAQLLDASGNPVSPPVTEAEPVYTDADGRYELFLQPQGRWRVQALKGNFISRHDVDCLVNEITEIDEGQQCVSVSGCRFLAAQGVFDRVEQVLQRVGVPADQIDTVNGNPADLSQDWAFATFGVYDELTPYCGIFFNCGIDESPFRGPRANQVVLTNLRRFVQEKGGTLYASDQSYDVIEAIFPEKVDWFRNDDLFSDAEYGLPGLVTANVVDDGLRAYLQAEQPGQETVSINFAYQSWALVQRLDPDVQVFLKANVQACSDGEACTGSVSLTETPLTIRFPVGMAGGQVIFTSFHVETRSEDGTVLSTPDTDRVMRFLMTL